MEPPCVGVSAWLSFTEPTLESWFRHYVTRRAARSDLVWLMLNCIAAWLSVGQLATSATAVPPAARAMCAATAIAATLHGLLLWCHPAAYLHHRTSAVAACRLLRMAHAVTLYGALAHQPHAWLPAPLRLLLLSPTACSLVQAIALPLPFRTQLWTQALTVTIALAAGPAATCGPIPAPRTPATPAPAAPAGLRLYTAIEAGALWANRYVPRLVPVLAQQDPVDPCPAVWAFSLVALGFLLPSLAVYASEARARAAFMRLLARRDCLQVVGLRSTLASLVAFTALGMAAMLPVVWDMVLLLQTRALEAGPPGGRGALLWGLQPEWVALVATAVVVEAGVKLWGCAAAAYVIELYVQPLLRRLVPLSPLAPS